MPAYVEVCGEDEVAEVDAELPAPDGEPLQVGHLRAGRQGQGQVNLELNKSSAIW